MTGPLEPPAPPVHIRRVFVHIAGYYPLSPEANQRRFQREYDRFLRTWSLQGHFGPLENADCVSRWSIETTGKDWSSSVDHLLFRWDDIIEADRARGWLSRFGLAWLTFADFIAHGALWRYLRHAWRYAGFFLYPYILMALIFTAALIATRWTMHAAGLGPNWLIAILAAIPLFFVLLVATGKALKLDHLLDDWIYARYIVRTPDPAVEARLSELANHLNGATDEILIIGHSFGAVLGARLIAMMVERRPDGPPIRFASVGASILKVGFNSAAAPLRAALARMAGSQRVIWHDYTTLNDVMNFHRIDPLAALGVPGKSPVLCNVRFRAMVDPAYYAKMQRNFFRLHNQFISGNDLRAAYDYFMLMCGPWPMEVQSASERGTIPWLDENGGLTAQGRSAALGNTST